MTRSWILFIACLFFLCAGTSAQVNCDNVDFESGTPSETSTTSISGWNVSHDNTYVLCTPSVSNWTPGSSHIYLVSTPVSNVPVLGVVGHSPLGGTVVAQIGDFSGNSEANKLTRTFSVTPSNTVFTFAFAAAMYYNTSYNCCQGPAFRVLVRDCQGSLLNCLSHTMNPVCNTIQHFTNTVASTTGTLFTNWQVKQIDLSSQLNSCVTIEVISNDCDWGGHAAVAFFDAVCGREMNPPAGVNYCVNGNSAILQAAPGYSSYAWSNNSGTLSANPALSSYTVSNPSPGQTFTAQLTSYAGCTHTTAFVLSATQVSIVAIGASASCPMGASGSASVIVSGSGSGYNFTWTNASNNVVGTSSVVQNLPPGTYSVHVSAQNNTSCGTAGSIVQVGNDQATTHFVAKPFCGSKAYFAANGGFNHQWYIGVSAVTGSAGTAPSLTVNSPANGSKVRLRYTTAQGCNDTIIYTLWQTQAQPMVTALFNGLVCEGSSNAQSTVNLIPGSGGYNTGNNYYYVSSTGSTSPYSVSVAASVSTVFTLAGLHAGGTYSIVSFDGSCYATSSFSVPTFYTTNLFSLQPASSNSLCNGNSLNASVNFPSWPTSSFTYSWAPLNFALGPGTSPNILITPTVSAGNSAILVYSVVVTPMAANCPSTKTIQVVVSNPPVPVIGPVAPMCENSKTIAVTALPPGGTFGGGPYIDSIGVIDPKVSGAGHKLFAYTTATNGCIMTVSSSFTVWPTPHVIITGSDSLCGGSTGTLTANGAVNYQWSTGSPGAQLKISPSTNTVYSVTGFSSDGCSDSDTWPITVIPKPMVTVSGNKPVCAGKSLVLLASGAPQLNWHPGPASTSYTVYPQAGNSYTAIGTEPLLHCTDSVVVTATVYPLPMVTASGPGTVCAGEAILLEAGGAETLSLNGQQGGPTFTPVVNGTVVYTISGTNSFGCSSTIQHTVYASNCLGLKETIKHSEILIYPNPARDMVIIVMTEPASLDIVDSRGRIVVERQCVRGKNTIAISELAEGIYNLLFSSESSSSSARLIKLPDL